MATNLAQKWEKNDTKMAQKKEPKMSTEVIIVTGNKVLRVPAKTWAAFLQVASLMVDTGDMYPHLESVLGESMLDKVKEVKYALDDHIGSS